jgi:rhodanese-related sulfurtransferase
VGPLVPDIIGNELNYIVALVVGFGFGFVLEQAGFSTSKKLVGLFYGYDFTVLRVFFTAGVTAMIGVIALAHYGLLDMSMVYVNPTFLWSAVTGGFIMGLGFILGGFCPGTSLCAAAIGKLDAMVFVAGSFFGVLFFAEGYPLFEGLYKSTPWGNVTVFSALGTSQSTVAFALIIVAVAAFWAVTMIETKVNGKLDPNFKPVRRYVALSALAVLVALSAFLLPDRRQTIMTDAMNAGYAAAQPVKVMTPDELAFRLIDDDADLQIFDFRDQNDYDAMSLPHSSRFALSNLFEKDAHKLLSLKHKRNVFVANDEQTEHQAATVARELGFENFSVLQGGMTAFRSEILDFKMPDQQPPRELTDTFRFRAHASEAIPRLIEANKLKASSTQKPGAKRIVGGC